MRKIAMFAAAAALVGMTGVASAASLNERTSYKDEPVYAPSFTWTGFYLGGHAGGGWGSSDWDFDAPSQKVWNTDTDLSGGFGGVQLGYNLQLKNFVLGAEGSVSWGSIDGETTATIGRNSITNYTENTWLADISLRAGLALDRTLLYAKTGVVWGGFEHDGTNNNNGHTFHAATDNQVGWLIGGGVEFALNNNWSIKAEYNWLDFGKGSFNIDGAQIGADQNISTVKGGVNYRFGAGAAPLK